MGGIEPARPPVSPSAKQPWQRSDKISVLALFVAGMGFLFTLWADYQSRLADFAPVVTVGTVAYHFELANATSVTHTVNSPEFDPKKGRALAMIVVPLTIAHGGGKPGEITDVVTMLSLPPYRDPWRFDPMLRLDEREFSRRGPGQKPNDWIEGVFSSVPVPRGAVERRLVAFIPQDSGTFPGWRLRCGKYRVSVMIRVDKGVQWIPVDTQTVNFSCEALSKMDLGTVVQTSPEVDRLRNELSRPAQD